jgi:hypothetical protein
VLDDLVKFYDFGQNLNWTPSPVVTIDGQQAANYALSLGLDNIAYLDADGIFNQLLYAAAAASQNQGDLFESSGGNNFGFSKDNTTIVFANGTTNSQNNLAEALVDFDEVDSGDALFTAFEIPATTTTTSESKTTPPVTRSLLGYPTPVVSKLIEIFT